MRGFNVEILAIRKQHTEIEHSYFKNKCNIYYLSEENKKLTIVDIFIGLPLIAILFFDAIRFAVNPYMLPNLISLLLRHRKRYDHIYTTYNVITSIYGTYFKKVCVKTRMGFGIFDYYGGIFSLEIPHKHIHYKPWLPYPIIKFALSKIDFYTAFKEEFNNVINNLLEKLKIKKRYEFYVINPTLSFCPVRKVYKSPLPTERLTLQVLIIAGYEKFKGTFDFLNIAKEFIKNSNEFKWTFIGIDKTYEEVKKFVEQEGLGNKIELIKIIDRTEIVKLINRCDLVIHTSYIETGPAVLIEALVCNKPIFIMDVGIAGNLAGFCKKVHIYKDFYDLISNLVKISQNPGPILTFKTPDLFFNNTHFNATVQKLCWIFR